MQIGVDKVHVDDNRELHQVMMLMLLRTNLATMVEGEVEILSEKNVAHEYICGIKKVEEEAEKLDKINSHQGSIMKLYMFLQWLFS